MLLNGYIITTLMSNIFYRRDGIKYCLSFFIKLEVKQLLLVVRANSFRNLKLLCKGSG